MSVPPLRYTRRPFPSDVKFQTEKPPRTYRLEPLTCELTTLTTGTVATTRLLTSYLVLMVLVR